MKWTAHLLKWTAHLLKWTAHLLKWTAHLLGEPQSLSGRCGEANNSRPCRKTKPEHPNRSLVTALTELPGSYILLQKFEI